MTALLKQQPRADQRVLGDSLTTTGSALLGLNRIDKAHGTLLEAFELLPAAPGPRMHQTRRMLGALAAACENSGRPAAAANYLAQASSLKDERGE